MIAELGLAALWLAAGFAVLQAASGFIPRLADLAAPAAWSHALLLALAFTALLAVFARVDLSVEAVIASADVGLSLPLRIAASWTGPAGAALLLAAMFGAVAGAVAFVGSASSALARLGIVALLLDIAVLALTPFARADPWPTAGNGLAAALQVLPTAAVTPLLAVGGALTLAGLAISPRARWFWAAGAGFAAAMVVASWSGWQVSGEAGIPALPAIACAAALLAAVGMGSRRLRAGSIIAFAGAVAAGVGAAGPVTRTERVLPLARLAPAAGPGWTAIVARLSVGGLTLAPEWRTYMPHMEAFARAAAAPGWRNATAVTLAAAPRAGSTRIVVTSAPLLPLVWAGGMVIVFGAVVGAVRR